MENVFFWHNSQNAMIHREMQKKTLPYKKKVVLFLYKPLPLPAYEFRLGDGGYGQEITRKWTFYLWSEPVWSTEMGQMIFLSFYWYELISMKLLRPCGLSPSKKNLNLP